MTRRTTSHALKFLAVLTAGTISAAAVMAQSPIRDGMEGNLSAYQLDGVYKGNSQRITSNEQSCLPGQEVAVEVRNGRVRLPWRDRQVFVANISAEGNFFATTNGTSLIAAEKHMTIVPRLQGYVRGPELVADYGTRWCRYRLDATQATAANHVSQR